MIPEFHLLLLLALLLLVLGFAAGMVFARVTARRGRRTFTTALPPQARNYRL